LGVIFMSMKKIGGFTLIEIIVIVAVLALLSVGAVMGVRGVQRNARIASLNADANALAGAINNFNASVTTGQIITNAAITANAGIDPAAVILTAPAVGTRPEQTFPVYFENAQRRTDVISTITFAAGTNHARVNSAAVTALVP
jgi:type II secretory pathway pseudopilin PulG